ncbi:centrosomal protein of 162 kDa [Microplitis mediator]|uniref:centrosomal protein of 162 kDa n=1 Tax=Microplitis mediator TaxID=375433 RepID=UPI002554487B|nr:centrosomal protein of 162 kDa [Microplitis mediator]
MTSETKDSVNDEAAEDLSKTDENSLSSSISLSIGECSVRLKEKPAAKQSTDQINYKQNDDSKWWVKKPGRPESGPKASKDVTHSSMREFLEKEKICKVQNGATKDRDDTLCDILASTAFDKYPSDFENATDDDIGSFLEEMSKIAGALSPNSAPERTKSTESSKITTEEEKSVEELLEEAEKLVRENVGLSKSASRSDTLVPDDLKGLSRSADGLDRVHNMEDDIFQLIEQEVHREMHKSPRSPRKRSPSPDCEVVYENVNSLKPPKSIGLQRQRFEEQKVEVSSSSDLDDPIERHSKSEDLKNEKKISQDDQNLRKEITDVDKDFFDDLLRRSRDKAEGKISSSSSFGQEDFSHFLKILQHQDSAHDIAKAAANSNDLITCLPNDPKNSTYPEKEITEILERELSKVSQSSQQKTSNSKDECQQRRKSSTDSSRLSRKSSRDRGIDIKKVINNQNELYSVGLTPRLELFADAIPKLIAEKSNEAAEKSSLPTEKSSLPTEKSSVPTEKFDLQIIPVNLGTKNSNKNSKATEVCGTSGGKSLGGSKSCDQLSKPMKSFRSLDDIRNSRSLDVAKKLPPKASKSRGSSSNLSSNPNINVHIKPNLTTLASRVKFSVKPATKSRPLMRKNDSVESIAKNSLAGGDSKRTSKDDWEVLFNEEKHKNLLLKNQIEAEARQYKQQIESMRVSFEEELFAVKKGNIILKAQIDELSLRQDKKTEPVTGRSDTRVLLLEKELEKQESLLKTYDSENKRLMAEAKKFQEEKRLWEAQDKKESKDLEDSKAQKLNDEMKDLREEILKLNFEVTDLRQKNSEAAMKNDDLQQQNSLVCEELSMYKEQLKTKDKFIGDKLRAWSTEEAETRRRMEEMRVELNSKNEKLRIAKQELERFNEAIGPLEKELLDLRTREETLLEKLQVSRSHVEREKVLTQKLKDQVILDNKKILDLNRQVREMERILKRKNPDSVSALILTAKSDNERINIEKVRLLEDRIASLEGEIRAKEEYGQEKLSELQRKFVEMKEKYTTQVKELEEKLREVSNKEREKVRRDAWVQVAPSVESRASEARRDSVDDKRLERRDSKTCKTVKDIKEDAHLIATIRGLKMELGNKDKVLGKLTRDLAELQKQNRKLQKEREKLVNDRKNFKSDVDKRISMGVTSKNEANDHNSNVYQNGHVNGNKLTGSSSRIYDPSVYSENGDNIDAKRLRDENDFLKEELDKINKEFMGLKTKRLHDLNLLQEEHERELAELVKEYSVKFGDSKVVKLQGLINNQVAVIGHLKEQIESLKDYKEQVLVLKVEREHLENKVKVLNEKVKYLSTPGTEQLQLLQEKITILQQRHESREMTLQNLVRELLRSKTQCRDCRGEKDPSNEARYPHQEKKKEKGKKKVTSKKRR